LRRSYVLDAADNQMKKFKFEELKSSPLVVDALYEGGEVKNISSEVLHNLLYAQEGDNKPERAPNASGFRVCGRAPNTKLVALTSNSSEAAWPDLLDPLSGQLVYFGDNKSPGPIEETKVGGNKILARAFSTHEASEEARLALPVFLYFVKANVQGYTQQFKGLVVPGGTGLGRDEQLTAVWRMKDGERFQNYRAVFTVLDVPEISRDWLNDILLGRDKLLNAPSSFVKWVSTGKYDALTSERVVRTRDRNEQLPIPNSLGWKLVEHVHSRYPQKDATAFEPVALALWKMLSKLPMDAQVTRKSRDGGRDAFGVMHVGPTDDPLRLDFALEAKCYALNHGVGVAETSRLISRLRRHHFGVMVTTSYIADQAYKEIRDDEHPLVLMTGSDIARVLEENGYDNLEKLDAWLDSFEA
jgi:hypothetical protein